jgi:hypothetical protein
MKDEAGNAPALPASLFVFIENTAHGVLLLTGPVAIFVYK